MSSAQLLNKIALNKTSLVFLALGGLLQVFGFGLWIIPMAAWFVPLFLLRYSRQVKPLAGALGIWLAFFVANSIANSGSSAGMPFAIFLGVMALTAGFHVLPYLADRLIALRLHGFAATLVLPLAWVTMELLSARLNPYGTWGSLAYTQYGNLPLMQLVSVTGLAGITFLICWFGSVVNYAWERNFSGIDTKKGFLVYGAVWMLVMLAGGARLAFAPAGENIVRIATIGTQPFVPTEAEDQQMARFVFGEEQSAEEREQVHQFFAKVENWFLENARREARAGAQVIAWPETAVMVPDTHEDVFLDRAGDLARQEAVYLLMGIAPLHPGEWPLAHAKNVLINPSGEVEFTYFKTHLTPGADTAFTVPGDGGIPIADTPYGRLASVICYDMDFPHTIVKVGRANVDVLIAPSGDWTEIGPTHALMAEFRAIENGFSLVRPARLGISRVVDPYGRILAEMDETSTGQPAMVSQVPVKRVGTLYSRIGDLFAWMCVAGFLGTLAWGFSRARQTKLCKYLLERRSTMKAIILDGSSANDSTGKRVRAALMAQLQARGWAVEHFALHEKRIGNCAGDFFCWVRNPGVCNVNDDNRTIAKALVASDLMVYLTPVTFGGYSSILKAMVDHQIQNVSPFFARVNGETHHRKRYKKYPDLLAVGWLDAPDAESEVVFQHLVQRNAINWHAKTWVSDVVLADEPAEEIQLSAKKWLDDLQRGRSSQEVVLPTGGVSGERTSKIRRALLLVGSPKTRKSTSYSLGGYLFEQLSARSVQTKTIYLHTVLRSPARMQALLDAVDAADLIALAFPIYVDALPAPVIEALDRIAAHRKGRGQSDRQLFTAIANCGFPEVHQTATGLAICELFARQAGFAWVGSLALGGGGIVNGTPLAEGGGKTIRMRQALELAAEDLAHGQAIPMAARDGLAKPLIPRWLYWLETWKRVTRDANGYGARKLLTCQPYLLKPNEAGKKNREMETVNRKFSPR